MTLLPEWSAIAEYCIDEPQEFMDRFAQTFGLPSYQPQQSSRYRLFDDLGRPFVCRLCGGNHWINEETVWACDHSNDEEYAMIPMAVRDQKAAGEVGRFEPV